MDDWLRPSACLFRWRMQILAEGMPFLQLNTAVRGMWNWDFFNRQELYCEGSEKRRVWVRVHRESQTPTGWEAFLLAYFVVIKASVDFWRHTPFFPVWSSFRLYTLINDVDPSKAWVAFSRVALFPPLTSLWCAALFPSSHLLFKILTFFSFKGEGKKSPKVLTFR